jgi:hypothetical protein
MPTDIKFEDLTPEQQEAYIARGKYKDPSLLDHDNAPKGAPSGPLPELEDGEDFGSTKSKKTEAKTSKTDK